MRDDELQDLFARRDDALPPEPFTTTLMKRLQRRERARRVQRGAAMLTVAFSTGLLVPELVKALSMAAQLPLLLSTIGGAWWELKLLAAIACVWLLARQRRDATFAPGLIARMLRWR